jgi:hypothetical protein
MKKICPFLVSSAVMGGAQSLSECAEDGCQMWCQEEADGHHLIYRSGCGLMPKENRRIP